MIQRLQDLETVVVKQLDRALSKVQNGIALCWTTVTTTIGQMVDTRVLGKVEQQRESMAQVELRDASVRCGCRPAAVRCRDQYGRGEQCAAWKRAVVSRPVMLCTGRALDYAVSAMYSWSMEAWRMFYHAYPLRNDARLVLMLEVLAILLDPKDVEVNLDAGCIEMTSVELNALDVDVTSSRLSKSASESSGRSRDSEFVCWNCEKRQ